MKLVYVFLLGLLILIAGCVSDNDADYKCPECNIVFISVDTLRADHLEAYGYFRENSPNLKKFAEQNIIFNNFFTVVPKTGPSMATFFTGKYVNNHGVVKNGMTVSDEELLLAEVLPENFKKGGFYSNVFLHGFASGFDKYEFNGVQSELTGLALGWLDKNKDEQFFLWVHYLDPHGPYKPPKAYRNKFVNDNYYNKSKRISLDYEPVIGNQNHHVLNAVPKYQRLNDIDIVDYYIAEYDAEIMYIDALIQQILDKVNEVEQDTIIIITADHGESLGESNLYFEHGQFVNEPSIRIPLIIHHPKIKQQLVVDSLLQNTDLMPTILSMLGIEKNLTIDGQDFSDLFIPRELNYVERNYIYSRTPSEYLTFYETIRTNQSKLVKTGKSKYEFYDIVQDPAETKNIFDKMSSSEEVNKFVKIIDTFGPEPKSRYSKEEITYTPEAEDQLRSLGYLN